jgi:hypothetical protein
MVKYYAPHVAVAATVTSIAIPVDGAKKVSFWFNRTNHSAGSTTFTVTGSVDGDNFIALNNILTDVTNTNAQTNTRVASVALSSNTSQLASLDVDKMGLKAIKVVCTIATDGKGNCNVLVEV